MIEICIRLAELAMPPGRREWLQAMVEELPHVPPSRRRAFALGCLHASLLERIRSMTATPPLRIVPGLFGAALLAVLCLANAAKLLSVDPVVGGFLYLAGFLWLAVLLAVQSQAAQALARLAVIGGMLYAAIGVLSIARIPAFVANDAMLKALSLEGVILFAAVFAVSRIPYFWAARDKGSAD